MKELHVVRLTDSYSCETCGSSYAEGYRIILDGVLQVDRTPAAHCYDGTTYYETDLLKDICKVFNANYTEEYKEE